jgi:hypothetical protein
MARSRKFLWGALALIEAAIAIPLAYPAALNALILARTRGAVLVPNRWYFFGMLFGDLIRIVPASLLIWHAVIIARKLTVAPLFRPHAKSARVLRVKIPLIPRILRMWRR